MDERPGGMDGGLNEAWVLSPKLEAKLALTINHRAQQSSLTVGAPRVVFRLGYQASHTDRLLHLLGAFVLKDAS
jgi:hypothetical protein